MGFQLLLRLITFAIARTAEKLVHIRMGCVIIYFSVQQILSDSDAGELMVFVDYVWFCSVISLRSVLLLAQVLFCY